MHPNPRTPLVCLLTVCLFTVCLFTVCLLTVCLLTVVLCPTLALANPSPQPPPAEQATPTVRQNKPLSVMLQSNPLLLTGVKAAHRVVDDWTEVSVFVGSATVTGCGIQASKCESGLDLNVGARRYLTATRLTGYVGLNIHYLSEGIRFIDHSAAMIDGNLGLHWQTWGGFAMGMGYTHFVYYDQKRSKIAQQGWLSVEIGVSF